MGAEKIVLLVVVSFIAIAFFVYQSSQAPSATPSPSSTFVPSAAVASPAASPLSLADACGKNLSEAIRLSSVDLCKQISCTEQRVYCLGLLGKDLSSCEALSTPDFRDSCFNSMAKKLVDKSLCGKIVNNDRKNYCFVAFDANESYCLNMNAVSFKDICYLHLASALRNPSYCDKIIDGKTQSRCRTNG